MKNTIFTFNQRDFIFPGFHMGRAPLTIALLFSIDSYRIFIIEYHWEKKITLLPLVGSNTVFAGFSKIERPTLMPDTLLLLQFTLYHFAICCEEVIESSRLSPGSGWINTLT